MQRRYLVFVLGDVQGVGFRWHTRRLGTAARVTGWVKNLDDGRVEIVAEGEPAILQRFIEALKTGHLRDHILDLDVSEEAATNEFDSFEIRF